MLLSKHSRWRTRWFTFASAVRGFHIYCRVWTPWLGQHLHREREHGNTEDRFSVAVVKKGVGGTDARTVVRHLPKRSEPGSMVIFGTWRRNWVGGDGKKAAFPACPKGVGNSMHCVFTWKEEINNQGKRSVGEKTLQVPNRSNGIYFLFNAEQPRL